MLTNVGILHISIQWNEHKTIAIQIIPNLYNEATKDMAFFNARKMFHQVWWVIH